CVSALQRELRQADEVLRRVREGHGRKSVMRILLCLLASTFGLFAAVDGVVMNATTGKPQASVMVSVVQPSPSGMQNLATVKSGADGKFNIEARVPPGPTILQGMYQGVVYNQVLAPG